MSHKGKTTPKPSPKNTLFNYFAKNTPKTPKPDEISENPKLEKKDEKLKTLTGKQLDFGKRSSTKDSSDEEKDVKPKPTKKRRVIVSEDEDDSENTDSNRIKEIRQKLATKRSIPDDEPQAQASSPKVAKKTATKEKDLQQLVQQDEVEEGSGKDALLMVDNMSKIWAHETLSFLQPNQIRDKNKNRPNDPEYDKRTIHVPADFKLKQTPAMDQWWELKSSHFDCVFFFKVGKFYELYHHDAIVGVKELGFSFMGKNEFAHSGFPESAYEKMATQLVERGYKVARVEQTENPAMMEARCKREGTTGKFSKVMKREICQITDRGTQIFSNGQQKMTTSSDPNFLLTIAEAKKTSTTSRYGICFVDTSIGDFTLGEFDDDQQCSRLLTLLSHYTPVLVLHERNEKAQHTEKIIKAINALKEPLTNEKQMWSGVKTLKYLSESVYSNQVWPDVLKDMQEDHLKPSEDCALALKALGGCLWYLDRNLLVKQVLALASFKRYIPPDQRAEVLGGKIGKDQRAKSMVLDNITLSNLNIFGKDNSLFMKIDFCCTQFGKRLLTEFLCSPTSDVDEIRGRQEAVKELFEKTEMLQNCRTLLSSLNVDLERSLAQIHQFGNREMKDHPNSRAILYETPTYGRNRISDFGALLTALDSVMDLPGIFKKCTSSLLKTLTQTSENGGTFEDLSDDIKKFKKAFDIDAAMKTGFAIPERNDDPEYDEIIDDIAELEAELREYLKQQGKIFGCELKYFGNDRKRYQIEVPDSKTKLAPKTYTVESSCKGKKRYKTAETEEFLKRMQLLEERKKNVMNDFVRKVFEKFSLSYRKYKAVCCSVAKLDVLVSFAEYARNQSVICVPEIHEMGAAPGESLLKIENGIHPLMNADDFIPNGMAIPSSGTAYFELITGPNMGGKSTLMREVALLSIMAQIGSMVPAESMALSVIDRIFTRLGANDNIMANQSTFLVELNETSLILKHCTHNSLVLLDELGRGTSTYDGTAIAQSVANFLANLKCRTLFSTHYHNLVDSFYDDDRIHLGHMACMVENENSEDITKENVTFLYKYVSGSSPKSFGFNAAKLAGIHLGIIRRAHEIAKKIEAETLKRKITSKILQKSSSEEIKILISKFKNCFV